MYKYYIEFQNKAYGDCCCLHSKMFNSKKEALDWYINDFDFICTDSMRAILMFGEFENDELLGDIDCLEVITKKCLIKEKNND